MEVIFSASGATVAPQRWAPAHFGERIRQRGGSIGGAAEKTSGAAKWTKDAAVSTMPNSHWWACEISMGTTLLLSCWSGRSIKSGCDSDTSAGDVAGGAVRRNHDSGPGWHGDRSHLRLGAGPWGDSREPPNYCINHQIMNQGAALNCCRMCGATSYRHVIARDDSGAMRPTGLYQCSRCSVVFADPRAWREGGGDDFGVQPPPVTPLKPVTITAAQARAAAPGPPSPGPHRTWPVG